MLCIVCQLDLMPQSQPLFLGTDTQQVDNDILGVSKDITNWTIQMLLQINPRAYLRLN